MAVRSDFVHTHKDILVLMIILNMMIVTYLWRYLYGDVGDGFGNVQVLNCTKRCETQGNLEKYHDDHDKAEALTWSQTLTSVTK